MAVDPGAAFAEISDKDWTNYLPPDGSGQVTDAGGLTLGSSLTLSEVSEVSDSQVRAGSVSDNPSLLSEEVSETGRCAQCGDELIGRGMGDVCRGCGSTPDSCPCRRVPAGYVRNEPPAMGPHPADEPASDTSDKPSEALSEENKPLTRHSDTSDTSDRVSDEKLLAGVHDGSWLHQQTFPPLAYAVDGLIPEGFTILVGPPKAGKSWLVLDLLLAVAEGGAALGKIAMPSARRVLYLALEDGDRRMQDRCRALLGEVTPIPELFSYKTQILPGTLLATITAWMKRHPDTALIIVDTLGKVMPPAFQGESSYQRDYRVGSSLKALADATPGLAVVVLHHDRKANAEDFVDSVSATHGLAGAADTIAVLCRKRQESEGSLKITGRDVPESEYALTMTGGMAWQLAGDDLAAAADVARQREDNRALSDTSGQVLQAVRDNPEGIRAGELAAKFGSGVYKYLERLTEAGKIDRASRGLYVPLGLP